MSNLTLNLYGVPEGTGAYNPVPSTFTATLSVVKLTAIVGNVAKPIVNIPYLSSVWNSPATFTATGTNFNFAENLNTPAIGYTTYLQLISNKAQPGRAASGMLFTNMVSTTGTFNMLAGIQG